MFKKSLLWFFSWSILTDYASPNQKLTIIDLGHKDCPHYDNYFNRLVMLTYRKLTVTTAVFIDSSRAITSYNPYRKLSRNDTSIREMHLLYYLSKEYTGSKYKYWPHFMLQLRCGRQIIPLLEESLKADQWHGVDRNHCPVHDLMVFRLSGNTTFLDDEDQFDFRDPEFRSIGPRKAELAGRGDELGATVKIGAIGIKEAIPDWDETRICSVEYATADVLLDCEEWLSRNWGYFICLDNRDGWVAMHSGAILVSDDKVFGIGSFLMTRGKRGVLAFTDVRPYHRLINYTCTVQEQDTLAEPGATTESTGFNPLPILIPA